MRFFVISDTHGNLEKVYEIYEKLGPVDAAIHLGDYAKDALEIRYTLGLDTISVKGNMDGAFSDREFTILPVECGKLYLSHGHMENVKMKYQNIYYRAAEQGCIAALFGHTHKPVFENINGLYLINPGSLSLPSDGTQGSCAIVETSASGLSGSILYYSDAIKAETAARSQGAEPSQAAGPHSQQPANAKADTGNGLPSGQQPAEMDTGCIGPCGEPGPEAATEAVTAAAETELQALAGQLPKALPLKSPQKKKAQGGYLRGLLNYSDRF